MLTSHIIILNFKYFLQKTPIIYLQQKTLTPVNIVFVGTARQHHCAFPAIHFHIRRAGDRTLILKKSVCYFIHLRILTYGIGNGQADACSMCNTVFLGMLN